MRLLVRGFFDIDNADDSPQDQNAEVYGFINFSGQQVWKVERKNAITRTSKKPDNVVITSQISFDVIFDDSATWALKVDGYMKDRDEGRGIRDDPMWNAEKKTQKVPIKMVYDERNGHYRDGVYVLLGQNPHGQSAILRLLISKASDIY